MMDIYDYISSPSGAVINGYNPCYLTKVSAVINRAYSPKAWRENIPALSLDDSVREFAFCLLITFLMTLLSVIIPLTCWVIAFFMPGSK